MMLGSVGSNSSRGTILPLHNPPSTSGAEASWTRLLATPYFHPPHRNTQPMRNSFVITLGISADMLRHDSASDDMDRVPNGCAEDEC